MRKSWHLYVACCRDHSLYAGIAIDVEARLAAHNAGRGAKYTRSRAPLVLVYRSRCKSLSEALKKELAFKALTRAQKLNFLSKNSASFNPSRAGRGGRSSARSGTSR